MDILFVATELAPMVKVGGLADVVAALSKALRLIGHNVTIALPRFPAIEAAGVMVARRLTPLTIPIGDERVEVTVLDGRLGSGVALLLLDAPGLFDRPGVYGNASGDYPDNGRRFGVFARAVVEIMRQRAAAGSPFDIVHLHDWPLAVRLKLPAITGDANAPIVLLTTAPESQAIIVTIPADDFVIVIAAAEDTVITIPADDFVIVIPEE